MAKGQQRSNKEAKKPKKDASPSKPMSPGAVMPTIVTVVPERGSEARRCCGAGRARGPTAPSRF